MNNEIYINRGFNNVDDLINFIKMILLNKYIGILKIHYIL